MKCSSIYQTMLGTIVILGLQSVAQHGFSQLLIINRTESSQGIAETSVSFQQNVSDYPYSANPAPSFEIYSLRPDGARKARETIPLFTRTVYHCPLEFNGNIPDGTLNALRFAFSINLGGGHFLSNALITAKVETASATNAVDVKKLATEGTEFNCKFGDVALGTTIGAVSGPYGLLTLVIEPPSAPQFSIAATSREQLRVRASVQPGATLKLYSLPRIESPIPWQDAILITNVYVPVTVTNFGGLESLDLTLDVANRQQFLIGRISTCKYYPFYTYYCDGEVRPR